MELRIFAHSWLSDWNHGNAHFLRGLARALMTRGHHLRCYEPVGGWSLTNLFRYEPLLAADSIREFRSEFPELDVGFYQSAGNSKTQSGDDANGPLTTLVRQLEPELRGSDIVILHEWSEPEFAALLLALRDRLGYRLLFLDTHHRSYSDAAAINRFPLSEFDGVIAFGEAVRLIYEKQFGLRRTFTLHEAADDEHFRPLFAAPQQEIVWIGNWGDEERTRELHEYLLAPASKLRRRTTVHGVRYPAKALSALEDHGIRYAGYLPNLRAPRVYAESAVTLHIPRGPYANGLGGIPTIRVFEALACGKALVCSPWEDTEGLFEPGSDYLVARDGGEMHSILSELLRNPRLAEQIAQKGRETILRRHTCRHRAAQLEEICREIG